MVDSPGAHAPIATIAMVTDGTSASASATSACLRIAAAVSASPTIIGA
jgi:hypothetical protein